MRILVFLSLSLLSPFAFTQQKDTTAIRYSGLISAADMKKHLSILASDDYEGRETGQPGQKKAADYIAAQFKSFGIPAVNEGIYFQKFNVYPANSSKTTLTINNKEYHILKDFYAFRGTSDSIMQINEMEFVGFGIDDAAYSDYTNANVKDKIALALDGEPMKDSVCIISKTKKTSAWSDEIKTKIKTAKNKGARALIVVYDDFEGERSTATFMTEHPQLRLEKPENVTFPVFFINEKMFDEIRSKAKIKKNKDELKKEIGNTGSSLHYDIKLTCTINYHGAETTLHSENVLGYVEGSDLKDQLIVISAHYDHLGVMDGKVFNGADDDGSGTTSVIELAQTFMKAKEEGHGPRRSILFMTVAGEEKGLLGSSYYVDHPVFPLANTVCDLNIDMVGRVDSKHADSINYVYLIGSAMLSTKLHSVSESCNSIYAGLKLDYTYDDPKDKNRFYYRSDHYNFAKNNIPVIFYFNGTHEDYHKETDEVDKINFDLMEKRVKLVFFTAWTIANMDERLKVDVDQKK